MLKCRESKSEWIRRGKKEMRGNQKTKTISTSLTSLLQIPLRLVHVFLASPASQHSESTHDKSDTRDLQGY